jgi:GTP-binding protein Era
MNQTSKESSSPTRCGHVAIVGLPNAGKSSLLNRLLDQELSIVTPVAQTTRTRVVGIDTRGDTQVIYLDTPGLVRPAYLLHEAMLQTALETIPEVDLVLLVVDASADLPELPEVALSALQARRGAVLIALNKSDRASAASMQRAHEWAQLLPDATVLETSATRGSGVEELYDRIRARMPFSPFHYPPDEVSSQPVRFFVTELIRESVLKLYHQEIPHSVFAEVDEFREQETPIYIRATIYVERDSQKSILIGSRGAAIRRLGETARVKIEELVGAPVYLDLWIKVLPHWRKQAAALRRLGLNVPNTERRT